MILQEINRFLRAAKMAETRFGREVASDPCLVSDIRKGREPRLKTIERILAYIGENS